MVAKKTFLSKRVHLYNYQKSALRKLESGSVLHGGVGSGKSIVSLAYYMWKECHICYNEDGTFNCMKTPKDLYIITTAKKRDSLEWEKEMLPFLLSTHEPYFYGTKATVDSWNNILKYKDVQNAFFILDEQRVVGYGSWVQGFLKIAKQNNWILLTATPGDVWMDYMPVFVANNFYRNKTDFVNKHVVYKRFVKFPQIDRYINVDRLETLRSQILVHMERPQNTIRCNHICLVDYDKELYNLVTEKLIHVYEDRPIRSKAEYCYVLRKIVNSDKSRLEKLIEILNDHKKAIVFYNFDYERDAIICELKLHHIFFREWNGHKHEDIPKEKSWVYLVQYNAGAEGWNCIDTDTVIFYSLNYSYKITEQAKGRIDRVNTPFKELNYYYLRSKSSIDYAINRSLKIKKIFNISAFAKVDIPVLKT